MKKLLTILTLLSLIAVPAYAGLKAVATPSLANLGFSYVNVTDSPYNAVCNWNQTTFTGTDDTAAINSALVANKNVKFPSGRGCYAAGVLTWNNNNVFSDPPYPNYAYISGTYPNNGTMPNIIIGSATTVAASSWVTFTNLNVECTPSGLSANTANSFNFMNVASAGTATANGTNLSVSLCNYGIGDPSHQIFWSLGGNGNIANNNYGANGSLADFRATGTVTFAANYTANIYLNGNSSKAQIGNGVRNEFSHGYGLVLDNVQDTNIQGTIDRSYFAGLYVKGDAARYNRVNVLFTRNGRDGSAFGKRSHIALGVNFAPVALDLSGSSCVHGPDDDGSTLDSPLYGIETQDSSQTVVTWLGGDATNCTVGGGNAFLHNDTSQPATWNLEVGSQPWLKNSQTFTLGDSNGGIVLPTGTTGQRPTGVEGMIRWNTSLSRVEYFNSAWRIMMATPASAISSTAPTIASGFCSSPTIPNSNGVAVFTINVGTSCAGSTGTLTMPGIGTGWQCDFQNETHPASNIIGQTGGASTTVTITNYSRTLGTASNWTDSDVLRVKCMSYP